MANPILKREPKNAIEELVYGVFDSPEEAADGCGVTKQTVYLWLGRGMIWNRETAAVVDNVTARLNKRIPASELMDLVAWKTGRGVPASHSVRLVEAVSAGARSAKAANGEAGAVAQLTRRVGRRSLPSRG